MKTRNGFVTNSSSTNYIVGVPQVLRGHGKAAFTRSEVEKLIEDSCGVIESDGSDDSGYFVECMKMLEKGLGVVIINMEYAGHEDFLSFCEDVGFSVTNLGW